MALTNSERQKRFREKRNELARRAHVTVPGRNSEADDDLLRRLQAAFVAGGVGHMEALEDRAAARHGGSVCGAEITATKADIRRRRLSEADLVKILKQAGEAAASRAFEEKVRASYSK